MSFKFDLYGKVTACLKNQPETRLTAREIAEWILENYREDCEQKRQRSKQDLSQDNDLIKQIKSEIQPYIFRKNNKIKITTGETRRFYWTEKTDAEEITAIEENSVNATGSQPTELKEANLYPRLAEFLLSEDNIYRKRIYSKRIDETHSRNQRGKNGNKWLHPDIVGLEYSGQNWHNEVKEIAGKFFHETVTLSSYEVKLKLNSANLREAFFQAVSNSSWANYGYLVAAEIDDKIEPELRLLANLHGIGIILLDRENPAESQYMIESAEREIDWDMVNRIVEENTDFETYIKNVKKTFNLREPEPAHWYQIPNPED